MRGGATKEDLLVLEIKRFFCRYGRPAPKERAVLAGGARGALAELAAEMDRGVAVISRSGSPL